MLPGRVHQNGESSLIQWQIFTGDRLDSLDTWIEHRISNTYIHRMYANKYGGVLKWLYPQVIHFRFGFSLINHPAIGDPPFMETLTNIAIHQSLADHSNPLHHYSSDQGLANVPIKHHPTIGDIWGFP